MNDVSKLPVWAQRYVRKLEGDIADLQEQIGQMDAPNSRITWGTHPARHGIPDKSHIEMVLDNGSIIEIRHLGSYVQISDQTAHNQLAVIPWVSNVIHVTSIEDK